MSSLVLLFTDNDSLTTALVYHDQLRAKKRKIIIIKVAWIFASCLGFCCLMIYLTFFAGIFDVEAVNINQPDGLKDLDILGDLNVWLSEERFFIAKKNNLLLLKEADIKAFILENFPQIKDASIDKEKHALKVNVQERDTAGLWCRSGKCFYFDLNGVAFKESTDSSGFVLTVIKDMKSDIMNIGDKVSTPELISVLLKAEKLLESSGIAVKEIIFTDSQAGNEFEAVATYKSHVFKVYLSAEIDVERQLEAFNIAWGEKITPSHKGSIEYVDLRVPDRIYYK